MTASSWERIQRIKLIVIFWAGQYFFIHFSILTIIEKYFYAAYTFFFFILFIFEYGL